MRRSDALPALKWHLQPVAPVDIPARPPGLIEIALSGGTTVRVDARIDPRALRRVLTALRG
jgi:hypothetical protein